MIPTGGADYTKLHEVEGVVMALEEQWIKTVNGGIVKFSDISQVYVGWEKDGKVMGRLRSGGTGTIETLMKFDTDARAEAFLAHLANRLGAKTLAEIDLT